LLGPAQWAVITLYSRERRARIRVLGMENEDGNDSVEGCDIVPETVFTTASLLSSLSPSAVTFRGWGLAVD